MKLIFALGNPGTSYAQTRHNVGWLVLDALAEREQLGSFQTKSKFSALILEATLNNEKVILAKPTTFYNQTGQAARQIVDFYRIAPEDVLVIHDELSLDFGTLRVRDRGSDGGNNGIKSLNAALGEQYWRLRIGTGKELAQRIDSADFVLSRFSADEQAILHKTILPATLDIIDDFLAGRQQVTSYSVE